MSGIKNKLKTLVSLMMIFAMIFTSVPSMADEIYDFTGTFQVIAGQNEPIGSANVTIDSGMLTIHVIMDPDWPADEYSLYLLEEEPTDRLNPGHAPYKNEDLDKATDFTIGPIDLSLPELAPGQCLTRYLVLHLVSGTETAYPGDIIKPDKGPWYGFITVTICEPKTTPTGSITLQKIVENSEGQPLSTDDTPFIIEITHPDSTTTTATITGNGTAPPLTNLPLGTYTISEAPPANYTLQSITSGTLTATNDLQITISEADLNHHVTVTNQKNDSGGPDTWSLILTKKVVDSQNQILPDDITTFAIKINGLTPPSNTTFEHTVQLVGNATSPAIPVPGPGDYQISELAPIGYTLQSIKFGDTILTEGVITLSESDHTTPVEITVTNQKEDAQVYTAALKLTKKVVDADHKPISTNDTFNIEIKYPDGTTHTHSLKGDGTPVTLNSLDPGTYTITEDAPEGYTLKSIQSGDTTTDGALTITLSGSNPETTAEVTVTNQQDANSTLPTGTLTLIKQIVDTQGQPVPDDHTEFTFTLRDHDTYEKIIKLAGHNVSITLKDLPLTAYTLSEASADGYTLKSITWGNTTVTAGALSFQLTKEQNSATISVTNERETDPPDPPGDPDPPPNPQDKKGQIRVHKFLDTNKNNLQESSEFDMQNITFELYAADKTTLLQTKKSSAAGDLTFTNLRYGTYYLREVSDYTITSPSFSADGFSPPITINSTQALTFNVGNYRDTTTEDVPPEPTPPLGPPDEPPIGPPDGPPETEIVEEEPPPLGAPPWEPPNELPPTGEAQACMLNLLGTLLLLAGAFLKYQY